MKEEDKLYLGSTDQAPGAWPNGTRVSKINTEPVDIHPDGALATIIGSIGPFADMPSLYAYCVEWDDHTGLPVWISAHRLALLEE